MYWLNKIQKRIERAWLNGKHIDRHPFHEDLPPENISVTTGLTLDIISRRLYYIRTRTYHTQSEIISCELYNRTSCKIVIDNITTAAVVAKNNQARAIAVSTLKRAEILPDTPTFDESGASGFELSSWQGLFGPRGLPAPVLKRLTIAMKAAVDDPLVRTRLREFGSEPVGSTPEEFLAYIKQELPKWGQLVKMSGATVD